jgi:sugar lactone lactonase YvrE
MSFAIALVCAACGSPDPETDPDASATVDAAVTTIDAVVVPDAFVATDAGSQDCDVPLDQPLTYTVVSGPGQSEDFTFDKDGGLLTITNGDLIRYTKDGQFQVIVPGVVLGNIHGDPTSHGFATLPDGDIIVADSGASQLVRVNPVSGSVTPLLGDLPFPNGVAVDQNGAIYATIIAGEPGSGAQWPKIDPVEAGVLIRVDADTGAYEIVARDMTLPNGLAFSPDYSTLHISSHWPGGFVYSFDTATDELTELVSGVGTDGSLDGIAVDNCGNVYVTEIGYGAVWRISEDGSDVDLVTSVVNDGFWIPNLHFGSGKGGWSSRYLYVIDYQSAQTYEVPIDVPGTQVAPQ